MRSHVALLCVAALTLSIVLAGCGGSAAVSSTSALPTTPSASPLPATSPTVVSISASSGTNTSDCGAAWVAALDNLAKTSPAQKIDDVQIVSWNDYENGSQLEAGVDNCVSITPSITADALTWDATGNVAAVDHYTVFMSSDGQTLSPAANVPTNRNSLDLASLNLSEGTNYTFFVQAVGKPSVVNKLSSALVFSFPKAPPKVSVAVTPGSGTAPVSTSVTVTSSASGKKTIASQSVDFGDGATANAATATHIYSAPGIYTVTATATDSGGLQASATASVTVAAPNQPPVAKLSVSPSSGTAPLTVNASTAGSTDPDGTIASTTIDFGDGTVVSAASGSHTYSTAGSYTVKATVTDNQGATATASATVSASAAVQGTAGTTWYIRSDGGTRYSANQTTGQCNGQADAPYPGSGINQPCAFNDLRYLWADGTSAGHWAIAGGDTVIIRGGPWRVGYNGPNPKDTFNGYMAGDPYNNFNPPVPAGAATQHTRILGENYANCTSKTQLFGGYGDKAVLNLKGTQYVDVACVELTDHAQCSRTGSPMYPSTCASSYPLDDWAASGIITDNTTANITLQDLNIHGFTSRGILGAIGGPVSATRVHIGYNAQAGWDFDDGTQSNGTVNASYLTVEWSGCNEEYPISHAYPAISCYDQSSAGYGDGIGTPDTPLNFTCDHCLFRYNTQDGFDLLHTSGSNITITNSESYSNMGQQWKLGPMASVLFSNNLTVHNCSRMKAAIAGAPSTFNAYLTNFCRAAGDGIAMAVTDGGTYRLQDNSFVGYGATSYDVSCKGTCTQPNIWFQNNLNIGYANPTDGQLPGVFYFGAGVPSRPFAAADHNIYFRMRSCPVEGSTSVCTDPKIQGEPSWVSESSLDAIDFHLTTASANAIGKGIAISGITTDYAGTARSISPSIGAYE